MIQESSFKNKNSYEETGDLKSIKHGEGPKLDIVSEGDDDFSEESKSVTIEEAPNNNVK